NATLGQRQVHGGKHLGRPGLDGRVRSENTADEGRVDGGGSAFAAYVADGNAEAREGIGKEVVKIAADGASGNELRLNLEMGHLGKGMGQQAELQLAGESEVALQALFLAGDFFIEPGVFDGDGELGSERRESALVIFREIVAAGVLEIEHADDFLLVDKWDGQLGASFRINRDVARILGDIGHQDCLFRLRGIADHTEAEPDVMLEVHSLLKALRKTVLKFFSGRVEQQDAEHLVIDEALQYLGDALEQFVKVENRTEFARDFVEQGQGARLAADAGVKASVFDAHRHARGDQREHALVLLGEVALFTSLQVDHADHAVLDNQRDGQLGLHVGQSLDVVIGEGCIGDEHGLASLGGAAGHPLANFHAQPFGDFWGIADLKADVELLALLIEQEDREDFIVDDFADQFGNAPKGGFKIERGVDHVGDLEQKRFHLK